MFLPAGKPLVAPSRNGAQDDGQAQLVAAGGSAPRIAHNRRQPTDPVSDRRTFLAGTGAVLLAVSLAAEAQQTGKVWRIGFLGNFSPTPGPPSSRRHSLTACASTATLRAGTRSSRFDSRRATKSNIRSSFVSSFRRTWSWW